MTDTKQDELKDAIIAACDAWYRYGRAKRYTLEERARRADAHAHRDQLIDVLNRRASPQTGAEPEGAEFEEWWCDNPHLNMAGAHGAWEYLQPQIRKLETTLSEVEQKNAILESLADSALRTAHYNNKSFCGGDYESCKNCEKQRAILAAARKP